MRHKSTYGSLAVSSTLPPHTTLASSSSSSNCKLLTAWHLFAKVNPRASDKGTTNGAQSTGCQHDDLQCTAFHGGCDLGHGGCAVLACGTLSYHTACTSTSQTLWLWAVFCDWVTLKAATVSHIIVTISFSQCETYTHNSRLLWCAGAQPRFSDIKPNRSKLDFGPPLLLLRLPSPLALLAPLLPDTAPPTSTTNTMRHPLYYTYPQAAPRTATTTSMASN